MDDHSLQEALFNNYIKETVDECANRIHQLSIRGEIPTKGGIEHYTYKLGRLAMEHYKDPKQIIEHVSRMNSFRSLDDKYAKLVVDSIKEYIQDFNKEKEFKESNSKKIVVFGRASGKNMAGMRSLLKDVGLSREAIREIFDEMEEDDE